MFDGLKVHLVCGDPALYIDGKRVAKLNGESDEGKALSAWRQRQVDQHPDETKNW